MDGRRCEEIRNDAAGAWPVSREESGKPNPVVSSADVVATEDSQAALAALSRLSPTSASPRWRRACETRRRQFIGGNSVERQSAASAAGCR